MSDSAVDASAHLRLTGLSKRFDATAVLDAFSLSVAEGEFVTLLGPSGCGKTTLLRLVAGLVPADSGRIFVNGADITELPAHRRNIGMVFQSYALFPHLNVHDNIAFGLRARRVEPRTVRQEVDRAIDMVQLGDFAERSVKTLSGGQQQRVSLARAIVTKPTVMLLDEPFSALDRKLRETMQIETRQILRRIGATAIFVTHDQEEALILSDRIVVMNDGRAEQIGTPEEIYATPESLFVLNFVGQALRLRGTVKSVGRSATLVATRRDTIRVLNGGLSAGQKVIAAVRPEKVELGVGDDEERNRISATVREFAYLGARTQVLFEAAHGDTLVAELSSRPGGHVVAGSEVSLSWPISSTLCYPDPG